MPCLRRGSGAASPGERRRPVGEQRPRRACLLRQPPRRARMEAAADGARYASPSPKGACHAPGKEASRRRRLPPKHNCLNMLWMEVSLVSFVRLLGHGRARAKAEPRLVLQICSHCTSKVHLMHDVGLLCSFIGLLLNHFSYCVVMAQVASLNQYTIGANTAYEISIFLVQAI
ncbi:hypothetical protein PVAP13_2NG298800 [Panicum virgatum]|uniref:Uncharacterized protein n=1 Tax=Panicum virgatum TaxID=38727 RepID=A0A8T0VD27_PANVG|nr:hypothetical protein PVAP13_2NG298800 [Panicum virgatum]